MYKSGSIHEGMFNVLQEWYAFIDKTINIRADLISRCPFYVFILFYLHKSSLVYLKTTPEVVLERMRKRAREEESCVPLKYLQELHELHEDWLVRKIRGPNIPVIL